MQFVTVTDNFVPGSPVMRSHGGGQDDRDQPVCKCSDVTGDASGWCDVRCPAALFSLCIELMAQVGG